MTSEKEAAAQAAAVPQVSIIVPVYNVEAYLRRCLDSIIAQTIPDWECICVDDGSPDGCGAILDEYAARDARFVVIHKENGGVSTARNAGLDAARGEFIGFVDPDDWIEPNTYELALKAARENDADLVQWEYVSECGDKSIFRDEQREGLFDILQGYQDYNDYFSPNVVNKLFRSAFIFESGIRFPVGVKLGEDTAFTVMAYALAQKCFCLNRHFYHYDMTRETSVCNNTTPDMFLTFADALKDAFGFIDEAMCRETEKQRNRETEKQRSREAEKQR